MREAMAIPTSFPATGAPSATGSNPTKRTIAALVGILLAAIMAGLNARVSALALADLRGQLGYGIDQGSWINTAYSAGELAIMPFAAWFAITLSVRRFHLCLLVSCTILAAILPYVQNLNLLLVLRFAQGISCGGMIPILMMAALKFLPLSIRLHGLALFALTSTFAPNVSIWLTGQWTDVLVDWRFVYWQVIPMAAFSSLLVGWGLPKEPIQIARFRHANWFGMAFAIPSLCLLTIGLDQGSRLDWFNSPLITTTLTVGCVLLVSFFLSEWHHPQPFLKLQMLSRRNLGLGLVIFACLLVVLLSGSMVPSTFLGQIQGYKALQGAPLGLIIALPQLFLGSIVALILYQKWIDARIIFVIGLCLISLACLDASFVNSDWNGDQFIKAQVLQALGQPMAIVPMLFLITSVVHPSEGPYVSGTINTLRVFSTLSGAAVVGQFVTVRGRFHSEMLLNNAGLVGSSPANPIDLPTLQNLIADQAVVLATADAYRLLGSLGILLIPLVLGLSYIPSPSAGTGANPRSIGSTK